MAKKKVQSKKEDISCCGEDKKVMTKRFWVLVGLVAASMVITGVSVTDGNRVTTWVMAILTIVFAIALIGESTGKY